MTASKLPLTLFLDANILVSAAWKENAEVAQIWQLSDVLLVTSDFVMDEVMRNLHGPSPIERLRKLMLSVKVHSRGELPSLPEADELPAKDRPVLAGAIACKANLLITGDKRHFGSFFGRTIGGVRVTAPAGIRAFMGGLPG